MPISASFSSLKSQLSLIYNLKESGKPDAIANIFAGALSSAVPLGLYPPGPSPKPLIPSGFSSTFNLIKQAHSLDIPADPDKCSKLIALGISQLVSDVPPIGLKKLESDIKTSIDLKEAATSDLIATLLATGIINYYLAAGVI